jgi:hypothetical protein
MQAVTHVSKKPPASIFIVEVFIINMDQARFSGNELLGYTGSHYRSHRRKNLKPSTVATLPTLRHSHNQTRTYALCILRVEVLTSLRTTEKRTRCFPSPMLFFFSRVLRYKSRNNISKGQRRLYAFQMNCSHEIPHLLLNLICIPVFITACYLTIFRARLI